MIFGMEPHGSRASRQDCLELTRSTRSKARLLQDSIGLLPERVEASNFPEAAIWGGDGVRRVTAGDKESDSYHRQLSHKTLSHWRSEQYYL